mmetsp:Transcript_14209/g.21147  ORF Transcript_14209/g.21147 Transcript_14209/m.21147 type:complete len:289 (-) Transcript_14209:41-907(-)
MMSKTYKSKAYNRIRLEKTSTLLLEKTEKSFEEWLQFSKSRAKHSYYIMNDFIKTDCFDLVQLNNFVHHNTFGKVIFQEENSNDNKRLQRILNENTATRLSGVSELYGKMRETFSEKTIGYKLSLKGNLLKSLDGCGKQRFHSDNPYDTDDEDKVQATHDSFICILAVEEGTKLYYLDEYKVSRFVNLSKGQLLVARGSFIHAGSDYDLSNIRFHFYLDAPKNGREKDSTYFLDSAFESTIQKYRYELFFMKRKENILTAKTKATANKEKIIDQLSKARLIKKQLNKI